jgi:hypothetical protein
MAVHHAGSPFSAAAQVRRRLAAFLSANGERSTVNGQQ